MVDEDNCIFCKIAKGEIPVDFVYENEGFFAIPDKNPVVPEHTLIISKKHFENFSELPVGLGKELIDAVKSVAEKKLGEGYEGFNVVSNNFESAGQIVMHFHIHLLPRKKGDGFSFRV